MRSYLLRHLQACFYSLGELTRNRLNTAMSAGVIGISLALPAGFYLALEAAADLSGRWDGSPQISLFMREDIPEEKILSHAAELRGSTDIVDVDYVSADSALAEFKLRSGFGSALELLEDNPLPAVLVVHPAAHLSSAEQLEILVERLGTARIVEQAQFDLEWVRRLKAILEFGERLSGLLAVLLFGGVLLIVGNTIRLAIFNRRDEIEVSKLIGATDAFIRRPFLYSGLQQGLLGGGVAVLLVILGLTLLAAPLSELAGLYDADLGTRGLSLRAACLLALTGGSLGWAGAYVAVSRHLREIEPG